MRPGKWRPPIFVAECEGKPEWESAPKPAIAEPRVQRALELFHQKHSIRLDDLNKHVGLSPSRFRHLFKQEVGLSPTHYFGLARLRQARMLLESSFLSVKEVAALVGVNDVSHFVRRYKLVYGETPSQTRLRSAVPSNASPIATSANK